LKVDGDNYILFECAEEDRTISIQQEYSLKSAETGEETQFDKIYSIKIHEITLRELLLFESLYVCRTQSDIVNLVSQQPAPLVFYKSFLEFDCSNMASILSFDSRSMAALLDESNKRFFSEEFPIFFKNKTPKQGENSKRPVEYYYRTAIDRALKCNQVKAVDLIIDYIVKFQNNYISSFMFNEILPTLLEKGITIAALLESDVFSLPFDFDDWPSSHTDKETYMRGYNNTIFQLRYDYLTIFPDIPSIFNDDEGEE